MIDEQLFTFAHVTDIHITDENKDNYERAQAGEHHDASFGHEALGGAAAFGAMKVFEDRQRKKGEPVNHALAKEMLAGLVGFEVDRFAESKGADWVDKEKAKREAKKQADQMYDQQYGDKEEWHPYVYARVGQPLMRLRANLSC